MRDLLSLLLHGGIIVDSQMAVENHHVSAADDVKAAGPDEIRVARDEQWAVRARVRPLDVGGSRVCDVVHGRREAVGRVEEEVDALARAVQQGGFDQRPVDDIPVEQLDRAADRCDAVVRRDFLEHDGCGLDRRDRVAARAAVAQRVAVRLVHDISLVRGRVVEPVGVDGAAKRVDVRAREGVV